VRGVVLVACLAAGCGRYGFTERTDTDAPGTTGGDGSARGDGSNAGTLWTQLAVYANSTCAVRAGTVYCWGDNGTGQLARTAGGFSKTPVAIPLPAGPIVGLSVGTSSGCAIVGDTLHCWGALGTPAPAVVSLPTSATSISVGHDFQCVVAGDALCWGSSNSTGQLGTGDTNPRPAPTPVVHSGAAYVSVEVGDDHSCALDSAGATWCWGHNDYGCVNLPMATNSSATPVRQDASVTKLPQIAGWHTCALVQGELKCWGEGNNGELGDGNNTSSVSTVSVTNLSSPRFVATGGGPTDRDASCAIDAGGAVKCWGNGLYGRLGQGMEVGSATPVAVVGLPAAATEVAIGYDHACAALVDGDMYCWGRGDAGQLGDGLGTSSVTAVKVMVP